MQALITVTDCTEPVVSNTSHTQSRLGRCRHCKPALAAFFSGLWHLPKIELFHVIQWWKSIMWLALSLANIPSNINRCSLKPYDVIGQPWIFLKTLTFISKLIIESDLTNSSVDFTALLKRSPRCEFTGISMKSTLYLTPWTSQLSHSITCLSDKAESPAKKRKMDILCLSIPL